MSGSALRKSGNRWEWATNEREWVGVDESEWDQVGVDVSTVQTRSTRRKWECVSVCGLEISHSWWECSENAQEWFKNEQKWVAVGGSGWVQIRVDESGWEQMGVDGSGWEHGLEQPLS